MTDANNKNVLIVDDDPGMQFVVSKRLTASGFKCESATTVEAGLEIMRSRPPNLVILDLGFAGSDGADFLQCVSKWMPLGDKPPPIIVVSCYNDQDIVNYAMDLGACGFVAKPYNATELVSQVREALL